MKLKNRIFKICFFSIVAMMLLLIYKNYVDESSNNILEVMEDGMTDPAILEFYQEEIENVRKITNGEITIYCFTIDLNKDQQQDKIVYLKSPLHSGSNGDTVNILINENGEYRKALTGIYRLFSQKESKKPIGAIYISASISEGFSNIEIISDKNQFTLEYENGAYHIVK